MYLKNDVLYVTIGDAVFTSYAHKDPQYVLDPDAITGWYDGASTRRSTVVRANTWGDFPEKSQQGSRIITLTGTARASTVPDLYALRDKLMGLFGDGGYKEMRVESTDGVRVTTVGGEGSPSWTRKSDTVAVWKLDMYAPDPRIYSDERRVQLGGGQAATGMSYPIKYPINYGNSTDRAQGYIGNDGNTDSWPKFMAQGNLPYGFILHNNNGKSVSYLGMVSPQAPVVIDMSRGTATQNGMDKSSLLSRREWFSIGPGDVLRPGFDPIQNGLEPITSAWCDIMYRDTWI